MTWSIHEDTPAGTAHEVLLAAIDALPDTLSPEDVAQARTAVDCVLMCLNVVGDPSVDPGVTVSLEGSAGSHLSINVDQIEAPAPAPTPNVPTDANMVPAETVPVPVEESKTGDPVVDNVPGASAVVGPAPVVEPLPATEPAPPPEAPVVPEPVPVAPAPEPAPVTPAPAPSVDPVTGL